MENTVQDEITTLCNVSLLLLLFDFLERGREGCRERERKSDIERTCNLGMCFDQESNPPFGV